MREELIKRRVRRIGLGKHIRVALCLNELCLVSTPAVMKQMAAAANRTRLVDGKPTSLADLGFNDIGLDVRII